MTLPHSTPAARRNTPHRRLAVRCVGVVLVTAVFSIAYRQHRTQADDARARQLHADTALMAAGIRADVRSIAAARARGDRVALAEATRSLRTREIRLADDIAALRTAHRTDASASSALAAGALTTSPR